MRYEINPNASGAKSPQVQALRVVQGDDQIRTGVTDHYTLSGSINPGPRDA